jgi:hypothetical protein
MNEPVAGVSNSVPDQESAIKDDIFVFVIVELRS